ncbi:MAG: sporulation protein YqfD [Bacilli bacterium]
MKKQLNSLLLVNVKGQNVERFIHRLISLNINLLLIDYVSYKEVNIKISNSDYVRIKACKSIYSLQIIDCYGFFKLKKMIKNNYFFIIAIISGIMLLVCLSNIIFNVSVVHTNKDIRKIILDDLENMGLKKFSFKKSYDDINKIKQQILDNHKDKIEWLEIEKIGTMYQVRLEMREIGDKKLKTTAQNVVAKQTAIIKKIEAFSGEIVKNVNDFVNKDDVIISGSISLNNHFKNNVRALGQVWGEVWYETTIEYPLNYHEIKYFNNYKNVYVFKFLNYNIESTFNSDKNKVIKSCDMLKHPLLPVKLVKQRQQEIEFINNKYSVAQALKLANKKARAQIDSKLNDNEYIISEKNLNITTKDSKIIVRTFFAVYEDITSYGKIDVVPKEGD